MYNGICGLMNFFMILDNYFVLGFNIKIKWLFNLKVCYYIIIVSVDFVLGFFCCFCI